MKLIEIPDGARGFDINRPLSASECAAFRALGYVFAFRYVRRSAPASHDVSPAEVERILCTGLGLCLVQHVAPEGWRPTEALGNTYGMAAAMEVAALTVPKGMEVWCDLEGVAADTNPADAIAYANAWYLTVADAGYTPGLYVGYGAGIGAEALYHSLRFTKYWGAYNLDADKRPATRGLQLRQGVVSASDVPPGIAHSEIDTDVAHADALGGRASMLVAG